MDDNSFEVITQQIVDQINEQVAGASPVIILDTEVKPLTVERWLIDYGKNREEGLSDVVARTAVAHGYIFDVEDRNFTDKGLDLLETSGVPIKRFQTITLGHLISPVDKDGKQWNLRPGSQVLVLFSGKAKKTIPAWDDVVISDNFGIQRIYRNTADTREEQRWPALWPLGGKVIVEPFKK